MRENHSPQLFGHTPRVSFACHGAAVYPEFNRELKSDQCKPTERALYGVDFNVARCVVAVCVVNADGIHVIQEWVARRRSCIERLRQEYQPWIDHGQLVVLLMRVSEPLNEERGISDFGLMKQVGRRSACRQPVHP